MVIPAGVKIGESLFGDVYRDKDGTFFCVERSLEYVIEAIVTRGRGYIEINENAFRTPYAENHHKRIFDPEVFCYKRLENDKFPGFMKDLKQGHPAYSKLYHEVIDFPSI